MQYRVLVVDDEALVANGLVRLLKSNGHEAAAATTVAAAFIAIETFAPDWVFSDLNMPDLRGSLFLLEVKRRFPAIQRALLSASLWDLSEAEFAVIEPCARVAKPCSYLNLAAAMQGEESGPAGS